MGHKYIANINAQMQAKTKNMAKLENKQHQYCIQTNRLFHLVYLGLSKALQPKLL